MRHPPRQCTACGKQCGGCTKKNHFKAVCKAAHWQQQDANGRKTVHKVHWGDDSCKVGPDEQDGSYNVVRVKDINLNSLTSIIFTRLESSMSKRQVHIVYKIDWGADSNLEPLKIFQTLFPRSKKRCCVSQK